MSIDTGIVFRYTVDHDSNPAKCITRLHTSTESERAPAITIFVIDGDVITHRDWSFVSTDLDTGNKNWDLLALPNDYAADDSCR
mmetsp:Transcript_3041/g.8288  ORF Transcript_3041/g.8288 Transcript_3041/m.8288 type:complete len:84 (+) Transcript_3041:244-495(+)